MEDNNEKITYFNILSNNNFPDFINKYIETDELQRLKLIGLFCGCDYTDIYSFKFWYSRLDHSIACALMTWHFTKDKKQTLTALFHDLGTPVFSHCVDYLLNDALNQEKSERNIENIILNSKQILNLLKEDNIDVKDVLEVEKYSLIENERPKICIDRLEGIFATGLIWCRFWDIKDIEEIYNNITILKNEEAVEELGFTNLDIANKFFEGTFKYSIALQKNENKYVMQFIADNLKYLIQNNIIEFKDLYILSETEIIDIIKGNLTLNHIWHIFINLKDIDRSNEKPIEKYYVSVDSKKRYVLPLIEKDEKIYRLNEISPRSQKLLEEYLNFKDDKYAFTEIKSWLAD